MSKINILFILAAISACSLTSCSFSDDFDDLSDISDASSSVNVNFTVSTRTDNDGDDDDALSDRENQIKNYDNPENASYRVYFFDNTSEHKYIMTFTQGDLTPTGTGSQVKYSVSGKLESSDILTLRTYTDGFIIVFIANWDIDDGAVYPDDADMKGKSIDNLCKGDISTNGFTAQFSCPSTLTTEALQNLYIPFYGVKYIESLDEIITSDNEMELVDINLLRAMAKVKVVNVTKTQTRTTYYPDLTQVKLVHYNAKGYCAPTGVYTEENYTTDDSEAEDEDKTYYVDNLHLVNNANDDQTGETPPTIEMYAVPNTNDSIWIAYVPEYDNTSAGATKCEIQYNVKCDGETTDQYTEKYTEDYNPGEIYFAGYDQEGNVEESSDYNIQRNRSYRFNVSLPKIFKLTLDTDDQEAEEWHIKKKSDD